MKVLLLVHGIIASLEQSNKVSQFIATDILLANDATITKGLVMGTDSEKGFIRSLWC